MRIMGFSEILREGSFFRRIALIIMSLALLSGAYYMFLKWVILSNEGLRLHLLFAIKWCACWVDFSKKSGGDD